MRRILSGIKIGLGFGLGLVLACLIQVVLFMLGMGILALIDQLSGRGW